MYCMGNGCKDKCNKHMLIVNCLYYFMSTASTNYSSLIGLLNQHFTQKLLIRLGAIAEILHYYLGRALLARESPLLFKWIMDTAQM